MGRPKSTIPLTERRKQARQAYSASLAARGLVSLRLLMPAPAADRLRQLARERKTAPGSLVADLLPPQ